MTEASRIVLLLCAILLVNGAGSSATALVQRPHSDALLVRVAADCRLPGGSPIPTLQPLEDPKLIAEMRKAGQLPDTFVCGGYRFYIAGDADTTYYVKILGLFGHLGTSARKPSN